MAPEEYPSRTTGPPTAAMTDSEVRQLAGHRAVEGVGVVTAVAAASPVVADGQPGGRECLGEGSEVRTVGKGRGEENDRWPAGHQLAMALEGELGAVDGGDTFHGSVPFRSAAGGDETSWLGPC